MYMYIVFTVSQFHADAPTDAYLVYMVFQIA